MLVGIIPNPYTERRRGNGKPKEKYPNEVLRYGRRKAADRREDEAATNLAIWRILPQNGDTTDLNVWRFCMLTNRLSDELQCRAVLRQSDVALCELLWYTLECP